MKKTFPALAVLAAAALASNALAQSAQPEDATRHSQAAHKDKVGPTWNKVAEKYRGRANAEEHLMNHLTGKGMALFPDGREEHHKTIRADQASPEEIRNLVRWILSL